MNPKEYPYKITLEADIVPRKESISMRKAVASALKLPPDIEQQPDLTYFTSIFVSSGTNLNDAHFLSSEMVMADSTISNKAVDIEHEEDQIIGHIYNHTFTDLNGTELDRADLLSMSIKDLDELPMHVEIASVIYKTRFKNVAKEVQDKKWKVSMEAYYQDYDIKIGDLILSKAEAEALGFESSSADSYKEVVKVMKGGEVVAEDTPARVLRGICFSGVGIVKNPANPPSEVLETSSEKEPLVLDLDNTGNNVTSLTIDKDSLDNTESEISSEVPDDTELAAGEDKDGDTVGICVNYKRRYVDDITENQDTTLFAENWCSAFDAECTAFGQDATDPGCLRNKVVAYVATIVCASNKKTPKGTDSRSALVEKINNLCDIKH